MCFNTSGKIIGGASDYPQLIAAKGRMLVEATGVTQGKPDSCRAYPRPSTS